MIFSPNGPTGTRGKVMRTKIDREGRKGGRGGEVKIEGGEWEIIIVMICTIIHRGNIELVHK